MSFLHFHRRRSTAALAPAFLLVLALPLSSGWVSAATATLGVRLVPPETADLLTGRAILVAEPDVPPGVDIVEARFVVDGALLAVDLEPPFQALWSEIDTLRDHLLRVTVVAADGSRAYDLVSIPTLGMVQRTTVAAFPPNFVLLDVTFLDDDGRPVVDVAKDEVRLLENGKRREVELLQSDSRPLAVELLLDASHSTRPYWEPMARSAELFARTLRPDDRATVEAFHDYSYVIAPLGSRPEEMGEAVDRFVDWGGGTRLFDSLSRAALYTLGPESMERRALIVLTDGMDQGSALQPEDAAEFLLRGDLELHAVLFEARMTIWPGVYTKDRDGRQARRVIRRMAEDTGGSAYDPDDLPMEEIFLRIGERLRAQYVVGFTSPVQDAPGEPRRIEVRLKRRGSHRARVRRSHFGTEELGGFLARQIRDSGETRQIVAARAAAMNGDPQAMRALVEALAEGEDLDRGLPREARLSLLSRGVEAVPYLRDGLENPWVREVALQVLVDVLVILQRTKDLDGLEEALTELGEGDAGAGAERLRTLFDEADEEMSDDTRALLEEVLSADPGTPSGT